MQQLGPNLCRTGATWSVASRLRWYRRQDAERYAAGPRHSLCVCPPKVKSGWTLPQRKQYFQFLIDASKHPGGNSYSKFLAQFRDDAIATCTQAEKIVLEPLINTSLVGPPIQSTPPVGPGRKWTTPEIVETVGTRLRGRDFKRGKTCSMLRAVQSATAWQAKVVPSAPISPQPPRSSRSPTWPMP